MDGDLVVPQLHQFFDAQFMAVGRKLLVFLRQPFWRLYTVRTCRTVPFGSASTV